MRNEKPTLVVSDYAKGILDGNRIILSQAITLIESNLDSDQQLASELINNIIGKSSNSTRIGITGVPGVGKSTFIESFGKHITSQGKKVAVLTVDPSSQVTKGSILGDKTRMEELSKNPLVFIRPSPSGNKLGGVTSKTRETIFLCEAAGYEVIIIETVGVGQSEVEIKNMVDFFLLLMLAGAGDELQGLKKGIMEMADALVITKADGENIKHAAQAQAEYQQALHFFQTSNSRWTPQVLTCSAQTPTGIENIWNMILKFKDQTNTSGYFQENRQKQIVAWFKECFERLLRNDSQNFLKKQNIISTLENEVASQRTSPHEAAQQLLNAFYQSIRESKS